MPVIGPELSCAESFFSSLWNFIPLQINNKQMHKNKDKDSKFLSLWQSKLVCYSVVLNLYPPIIECYRGEGNGTHCSALAWKIPWMELPGRLRSMWSLRVGHDWAPSLSFFTFLHWRRKWQLTPVFLPGESQGQGNLVGCRLWGCTESDTAEVT